MKTLSLRLTTLAGLVAIAAPCLAQTASPSATASPSRATPHAGAAGAIDIARSRVYAHVHKTGLGHEHGVEGRLASGHLLLDAAQPSGQMTFDLTSFQADTSAGRRYVGLEGEQDANTQQQVTQTMQGAEVLDVSRYPTAEFVLRRAVPRAGTADQWDLFGDFTLHGVTRPVQVSAHATTEGAFRHIRGGFTIRQTEYGIRPLRKALGVIGVADAMEIWGDLWVRAS